MSMCNDNEPLSLGALLSNDSPQTSKEKHAMMKSIRESTSSLKSIETSLSSKSYHPSSPTTSISESNIMAISELELNNNNNTIPTNSLIQNLKFDAELDGEIQSPTNSIWDSLFSDQIDASADFMLISSPRREFMISSPKRDCMMSSPLRDYMISSPKRDYMISSPKREYMVASPKKTGMSSMSTASMYTQNFGYVHGAQVNSSNLKGKSLSPLHKVFNVSSSSSTAAQYDALLDEFGLYSNFKEEITPEVYDVAAIGGMTATLMECMSMPSMSLKYEDDNSSIGVGTQISNNSNALPDYGMTMNGNVNCYNSQSQSGGLMMGNVSNNQNHDLDQDDSGLHLVHLLLACAESAAKDDYISASRYLHHLNLIVSPLGDSMQRVASCFADALSSRLSPPPIVPPTANISSTLDTLKIYQILYQACPYIKFAHFTANQAIFEAFEAEEHVHVIDLDILQGYQWPAFLQALGARPGGPPSLRITGVGYPAELIRETGRHLAELAHSLGVPFEFHVAVADRLEELRPHMLHRRVGEALAVNSVNRLHRVPGPQLGNLLSMIRDQAPNIVTLVEQEAAHNSPHFLPRFLEALHYYSAIFDSLDATFPSDSTARAKVEQCIFLPEIRNIVACEGPYRVERHERLEKWRKIMEGKGFKEVALSQNAVTQSNILLGLYSCEGYRLNQDQGCLLLGWQDRAIIAASAWRC